MAHFCYSYSVLKLYLAAKLLKLAINFSLASALVLLVDIPGFSEVSLDPQ